MFAKGFFTGFIKRSVSLGSKGSKDAKKGGEAKTTFYRSHYIKMHPKEEGIWGTNIAGKPVVGKLENIKKSINNWYDTKVVVPPEYFDSLPGRPTDRQVVEYNGIKIINDLGGDKDWYVTHKGKLLKGSREAIERKIDVAIQRAKARKEAMVNKSIEMGLNLENNSPEAGAETNR